MEQNFQIGDTHEAKVAYYLFAFFGIIVLAISALTSFSFFYTYFPALIPEGILDGQVARIISGVVGTILFDISATIWLTVFLNASETAEQRAVAIIMTVVSFIGAGAASIAYLVLSATGELSLGAETKESVAMFALVVVVIGVIANFGFHLMHKRYSKANKELVRENKFQDRMQALEDNNKDELFNQIEVELKELLKVVAPIVAAERAEHMKQQFVQRESVKRTQADSDANQGTSEGVGDTANP